LIPHAERAFTAKRYRYVKVEPELVEYSQDLQEEKARIHFRDCFVQSNKKLSEVLNSHVKMTDRCSLFVLPRKLAYILLPSLQWKFFCRTSNAGGYQLRDVHVAADWSAIIFVLPGRSTQGRTPNCLVWSFGRWNAVSSWNFRIEKFLRLIEAYRCSKINGGLKGIALRGQHWSEDRLIVGSYLLTLCWKSRKNAAMSLYVLERFMDSDRHRAKGICFGQRLTMLLTASHLAHSYPMAHFWNERCMCVRRRYRIPPHQATAAI